MTTDVWATVEEAVTEATSGPVVVEEEARRDVPWSGLGVQVMAEAATDEQVLREAGLDWQVTLEPAYRENGGRVKDAFFPVRTDTGALLGNRTVGRLYRPIQNRDLVNFGSLLVDEFGAKWDTAGAFKGGSRVFASLRIPNTIEVQGKDAHDLYLLLQNFHNGGGSLGAYVVIIRAVCENTVNMAIGSARTNWTLRHVMDLQGRVQDARDALGITFAYVDEYRNMAESLAVQTVDNDDILKVVESLLPGDPEKKRGLEDLRDSLLAHIRNSATIEGFEGTKYGLLNAVTEWGEWGRTMRRRQGTDPREQRFETNIGGFLQGFRDEALKAVASL